MKVVLFNAMSVNGIICRNNGKEDFLSEINWKTYCKLSNRFKCLIMGRTTYDKLRKSKNYNLNPIKKVKKIIVSKNKFKQTNNNIFFVKSPKEAINKVRLLGFKEALLCSGGNLNTSFMKQNLINELILNIEPIIIGDGIKLFKKSYFQKRLKLLQIKKLNKEIFQLHYGVIR